MIYYKSIIQRSKIFPTYVNLRIRLSKYFAMKYSDIPLACSKRGFGTTFHKFFNIKQKIDIEKLGHKLEYVYVGF